MKTSPISLLSAYTAVFLAAVFTDFSVSVDAAAELSASTAKQRPTLLSKLNPRAIYPTAIRRDVAVTKPETNGGSLHGIVGQIERNLASRRLLINQDDAAKRVHDAVTTANQAVKNGETSGIALPLDYVQLSEQFGGTQQLTVRLRLPGVDKDQNVMIDTGSSSLAFCDKSLINEAKNISKTNYAQCNLYDDLETCPDGSTGSFVAYAGQVFRGDVGAYNDQGEKVASMDNVNFAIMDLAQQYACFGPLDGIIGVAYKDLNDAVELPSPEFNVSSLWNKKCDNPDQATFSQGYETIGNCNYGNMTVVPLLPPLEQSLGQDYISGQITSEAFGVYLDYAATIGSEVAVVPSLGIFFGGNLAYDNQFYNIGKVQVAETIGCSGSMEWYQLKFTSIRVPGFNVAQSTVDLCKECQQCITDTGTSYILLPLSQQVCNKFADISSVDELNELGSLFIDLTAADGSDDITLAFPLLWLREQYYLNHVKCTGTEGLFYLGLPITQYYYTVYDMGKNTVSFVELNGCFRHTIGLSLLAWTVFVPTAIAVITSL